MRYATPLIFLLGFLFSCGNRNEAAKEENPSADSSAIEQPETGKKKTILFFGNSLTAGYGVEPQEAFPSLIQHRIDSLDLPYTVVNAGVSGETTSGGDGRIDWVLQQPVDIFILELGANDGLRGIPVSETRKNLQSIIDKVRAKDSSIKIILAGMQIPPNMGQKYTREFREVFAALASENNIELVPFLLEGVGGEEHLNQADGIHPNPEGHKLLAENVWKYLEKLL